MNAPRQRRGFTLIELLMVIAIISILLAILLPAIAMVQHRVRVTGTRTQVQALLNALNTYRQFYNALPQKQTAGMFTKGSSAILADQLSERYRGEACSKQAVATMGATPVSYATWASAEADGWPIQSSEKSDPNQDFTPGVLDWLVRVGNLQLSKDFVNGPRAANGHRIFTDRFDGPIFYHIADPKAASGTPARRMHDELTRLIAAGQKPVLGYNLENTYPVVYSTGSDNLAATADPVSGAWWIDPKTIITVEQGQ